jgi:hypothetical protein
MTPYFKIVPNPKKKIFGKFWGNPNYVWGIGKSSPTVIS